MVLTVILLITVVIVKTSQAQRSTSNFNLYCATDQALNFHHPQANFTLTVETGEWNGTDSTLRMSEREGILEFTNQKDTTVLTVLDTTSDITDAKVIVEGCDYSNSILTPTPGDTVRIIWHWTPPPHWAVTHIMLFIGLFAVGGLIFVPTLAVKKLKAGEYQGSVKYLVWFIVLIALLIAWLWS